MSLAGDLIRRSRRAARRVQLRITRSFPSFSSEIKAPHVVLGDEGTEWCVAPQGINASSVVYSLGVGSNISFDEALIRRFGCVVHAFDPTPASMRAMAARSLPEGFKFIPLGVANYDGVATFEPPANPSHVSYRITSREPQAAFPSLEVRRIPTLMRQLGHSRIDLLKMDVEGAEYAVIQDILETKVDIGQMCIEFHLRREGDTWSTIRKTMHSLHAQGWRIFYVSPSGFEISLIRRSGEPSRSLLRSLWHSHIRNSRVGRVMNLPLRSVWAFRYYTPKMRQIARWIFVSREDTNFTYDLSEDNILCLTHLVALVTGKPVHQISSYIDEARNDKALEAFVSERTRASRWRWTSDARCRFGRRLGWYAFTRAMKPRVVVETGVDKGLGAVLLCSALIRNRGEGHEGRYFGTDIDPEAGWLLQPPYSSAGSILRGDSLQMLAGLNETIDLFIHDSDHSADYEYREYLQIEPKISDGAIILSDNAHVTSSLAQFSLEGQRKYLFFREVPSDHWYPGSGIGVSF